MGPIGSRVLLSAQNSDIRRDITSEMMELWPLLEPRAKAQDPPASLKFHTLSSARKRLSLQIPRDLED